MLGAYAYVQSKIKAAPWWQVPVWVVALLGAALLLLLWLYLQSKAEQKHKDARSALVYERLNILEKIHNGASAENEALLNKRLLDVGRRIEEVDAARSKIREQKDVIDLVANPDPDWEEIQKTWNALK